MKKILLLGLVILILSSFLTRDAIVIPDEAIRFRIIANSDSEADQNIKLQVKARVEEDLSKILVNSNNIDEVRRLLNNNLNNINNTVGNALKISEANYGFNTNFGNNYFPDKEYKGITYKEGEYESLVVTLGSGEGNNWWCVLFPPLCLLEAEENSTDEIEYQFFVKKLIDKYFK